jgi:hypothetical protein
MARLGIHKDLTLNTVSRIKDSFTVIEKVMLDRADTSSASTVTATALARIYYTPTAFAAGNTAIQEFSFNFTYTEPCPCSGLQPCGGEGDPACADGCTCTDGACVPSEILPPTCKDAWDEALMACKLLTAQTLMTGETVAYDYTTGTTYLSA